MQNTSFAYYQQHYAMAESSYPYLGKDGTCRYDNRGTGVKASTYKKVTANSISGIKTALNKQPVSILVEAYLISRPYCFPVLPLRNSGLHCLRNLP